MTSGFDPIITLMVEVKNASLRGSNSLDIYYSGYREDVLQVLKGLGLLNFKVFKEEGQAFKKIHINLPEDLKSRRRLKSFRIFSRPGRRIYMSSAKIKARLAKHPSTTLVSTSQGTLEAKEAVKRSLGGEVLFEV